jgi:hypothetical protein
VKEGDESAADMLESARALRETWGPRFPGFTGRLRYERDGETATGTVNVSSKGDVAVNLDNSDLKTEAKAEIQSLVMHRMTSNGSTPDKPAFAEQDRNPLGRAILLNDAFESMYRIRDGQVMQVNRSMGTDRFTIDVMHNEVLDNGRYLPGAYAVYYWDKDGTAKRSESYSEKYAKTGAYWLPSERRHVAVGEGKTSVTALTLTALKLNDAAEITASVK